MLANWLVVTFLCAPSVTFSSFHRLQISLKKSKLTGDFLVYPYLSLQTNPFHFWTALIVRITFSQVSHLFTSITNFFPISENHLHNRISLCWILYLFKYKIVIKTSQEVINHSAFGREIEKVPNEVWIIDILHHYCIVPLCQCCDPFSRHLSYFLFISLRIIIFASDKITSISPSINFHSNIFCYSSAFWFLWSNKQNENHESDDRKSREYLEKERRLVVLWTAESQKGWRLKRPSSLTIKRLLVIWKSTVTIEG